MTDQIKSDLHAYYDKSASERELASEDFEVYDFHRVILGEGKLHFQALLLRKA